MTKAKAGKFTCCLAPFGYRKSQADKNRLAIILKAIAEDSERIKPLEQMISRIYEEMVVGRITEDNADLLLAKSL